MIDYKKVLSVFPKNREEKLRAIKRYSMTEVFFYRSLLWHHSLRVALIVDALSEIARSVFLDFDKEKACILALVHDDAEIITGDVQLGHKELMTAEQLEGVRQDELRAIETLSQEFPKVVDGYSYKELLLHALNKDCFEAQLVSYADKVDAYCEAMHEVLGGNISALRSVIAYITTIDAVKRKYILLAPIFERKDSPLLNIGFRTDPKKVHWKNYLHLNKPHVPESIVLETEFSFYNAWKKLILEKLGQEGMDTLTVRTEGL
jgi:5'-deoxynucleotidase YfbR-like HD superfamily hydrolase